MAEQRYLAVLAVIKDGETVKDVAARFGVRRQTVHEWLASATRANDTANSTRYSSVVGHLAADLRSAAPDQSTSPASLF